MPEISPNYTQKADDTKEPIVITLLDASGSPVDTTNAVSALFKMSRPGHPTPKVSGAVSFLEPRANGQVRYDWLAADKDTPGLFVSEVEVTWSGGATQTFPDAGYYTILVTRDL